MVNERAETRGMGEVDVRLRGGRLCFSDRGWVSVLVPVLILLGVEGVLLVYSLTCLLSCLLT